MTTLTPVADREALGDVLRGIVFDALHNDTVDIAKATDAILALLPQAAREQALEDAAKKIDCGCEDKTGCCAPDCPQPRVKAIHALKSTPSPVERRVEDRGEQFVREATEAATTAFRETLDRAPVERQEDVTGTNFLLRAREISNAFLNANWVDGGIIRADKTADVRPALDRLDNDIVAALHAASLLRTPQAETQGGDAVERALDVVSNMDWQSSPENIVDALAKAGLLSPVSERERALEEALREIVEHPGPDADESCWHRIEIAKDALKSPATSPALDGWKPIETAPKDREIDLWIGEPTPRRVSDVRWGQPQYANWLCFGDASKLPKQWVTRGNWALDSRNAAPTHWMDKPEGPLAAAPTGRDG